MTVRTLSWALALVSQLASFGCTAVLTVDPRTAVGGDPVDHEDDPEILFPTLYIGGQGSAGHACALSTQGSLRCWGNNRVDAGASGGQLGYGRAVTDTVGDDETPNDMGDVPVGGLAIGAASLPVVQAALGRNHTCVLYADRTSVKCWGHGAVGQLGRATATNVNLDGVAATADVGKGVAYVGRSRPAMKLGLTVNERIVQLVAGSHHTCVIIGEDSATRYGRVKCWGENSAGQLGIGTTAGANSKIGDVLDEATTAPDVDFSAGGVVAKQLALGSEHSCALLAGAHDGKVRCWGRNNGGQLGYGNTTTLDKPGADLSLLTAAQITAGVSIRTIDSAVGATGACMLLSDDTVKCWGANTVGQLGMGTTGNVGDDELPSASAQPSGGAAIRTVQILPGELRALEVGSATSCAIYVSGNTQCWGYAAEGRLGSGATNHIGDNENPSVLDGLSLAIDAQIHSLAIGNSFGCGVLDTGSVRCWGNAAGGNMGTGLSYGSEFVGDDELPSDPETNSVTPVALPDVDLGFDLGI